MTLSNSIFEIVSLLLIVLLIAVSFNNFRLWKKTDVSVIKAKVFLNDEFIKNNFWMFTIAGIIIGLSIGFHIIMEMVQIGDIRIPSAYFPFLFFFYYAGLIISLFCLLLMGIFWRNILKKGEQKLQ